MNHFCIIGILPLIPSFAEEFPVYCNKAQAIQKALWEKNTWHMFYQGYSIQEDLSFIEVTKESISSRLLSLYIYDTENLKVSVCAIVGKNGSGKSSIVDLSIRMINNLSAALLGESFNFAAAEHLHFIDHVYARLATNKRISEQLIKLYDLLEKQQATIENLQSQLLVSNKMHFGSPSVKGIEKSFQAEASMMIRMTTMEHQVA